MKLCYSCREQAEEMGLEDICTCGHNVFENIMLLFLLADFTVIALINFTDSEISV